MSNQTYQIKRLRVRRDGYDATGTYWGIGPDVFVAVSVEGTDQITVRARSLTEARAKIAAERDRAPTTPRANTDVIGGNAARKTRYELVWRNAPANDSVVLRITHSRDYLTSGTDHIEIESIRPRNAPLPITETGYRSHFLTPLELIDAGGPVTFVQSWLEREAKGKAWLTSQTVRAQGDLFAWAEAGDDVTRKRSAKPSRPAQVSQTLNGSGGTPSRRRRSRDPE